MSSLSESKAVDSVISTIQKAKSVEDVQKFLNDYESKSVLQEVYDRACDAYYNTDSPLFSDSRFDVLSSFVSKQRIGAKIREGSGRPEKATLPFWLGSCNKITPDKEKEWDAWISKYGQTLITTDKLDGVSCLVEYKDGKIRMYSRGDGIEGSDISFLQSYISLPNVQKLDTPLYVRGELIISKKNFEKHKNVYKNARNMVAGLIGSKTVRNGLTDIQFVAYEIVSWIHQKKNPSLSEDIKSLISLGFTVVYYESTFGGGQITLCDISKLFMKRKVESEFEIDGIVVQTYCPYVRNTEGNPDYILAFKMVIDENVATTTVKNVEWNCSAHSQLKPVVIVEPVEIDGTTIKRATGHNAKYIVDNKIGKGAVIKITRSNQVIPFILAVITPAENTSLPEGEWKWDENKVNILSTSDNKSDADIKQIATFFRKIDVLFVSDETVRKLYEAGLDTISKIVSAEYQDIIDCGFKDKSAQRIFDNVREGMKKASVSKVLGASGVFGFAVGRKRVKELFIGFPTILTDYKYMNEEELIVEISSIKGFGYEISKKIAENIRKADKLISKLSPFMKESSEEEAVICSLSGETVVFTGFRDKELEEKIENSGGKVTTSITGKTTILIVKNKDELTSGKAQKAKEKGVKIMTKDEFVSTYF